MSRNNSPGSYKYSNVKSFAAIQQELKRKSVSGSRSISSGAAKAMGRGNSSLIRSSPPKCNAIK